MQIPGFIRGAANRGNKAAQAFVQQYDNGDNTPYDPNAYAAVKAQFDDYNGELDDNYEEFDEEEIKSPEEQRATKRIDELGEKYKPTENDKASSLLDEIEDIEAEEDKIALEDKIRTAFANEEITEQEEQMLLNKLFEEKDEVADEDLYEELADNEYIYGNLNKEQAIQVMQERTDKSSEEIKKFMDKNFSKHFWDDEIFDDNVPSEKEIDNLRKQEEMKKLDKEFPNKNIDKGVSDIVNKEEKPIHLRSLENQISRNPDYKKIADSLSNKEDINDAYFYAFKDAYEKHNYEPSNRHISDELSDAYWKLADDFKDSRGMSQTEWDRYGEPEFERYYGSEADFIDKGLEAHNKYFDELDKPEPKQEKYLAPEEIGIDYDYPEESIKYYEKKNNVKLYEQPNGSFKVIPNKEKSKEEPKQKNKEYIPNDISRDVAKVFLEQKFNFDKEFLNNLSQDDLTLAAKFFKKFNIDKIKKDN